MSEQAFHIDYETRSKADLTEVGTFRYAEDPSTEVMCMAISFGDERPSVWVNPKFEIDDGFVEVKTEPRALELARMLMETDYPVYAHNAQFEAAITHYRADEFKFDLHRLRCTAAMCRRAAIPAKLKDATATLFKTADQQKDKDGARLIQKFSIPDKNGKFRDPKGHASDFKKFVEYCRQDVHVEQLLAKELKAFELKGNVLETFLLDLDINMRGVPVNMTALRNAQEIIDIVERELTEEFVSLTGFNPSQRAVFEAWAVERGYQGADLTATTVDAELARIGEDSELGRALALRKRLSFASVKKVKSMIACAGDRNYVRGTLQYYGASTGRWSGRLIQPQNFKRPTIKHTHAAYADIIAGCSKSHLELMYGPALEVIGSCIRHFIQPHDGVFLDVDFAAIEARLVCWLAGQQDALDEFAAGVDRYKIMASKIYGVPVEEVNAHPQRFVGKQCVLGCGYSMGGPKFRGTCAGYNYELPFVADVVNTESDVVMMSDVLIAEAEAFVDDKKRMGLHHFKVIPFEDKCVIAYRKAHPMVCKFWYDIERAVKNAIRTPGATIGVQKVKVFCAVTAGAKYLFIVLPSGRRLAYRDPQITVVYEKPLDVLSVDDDVWGETEVKPAKKREQITFHGQIEGKAAWGRVKTYGGKLVENITQAVAADLMSNGAIVAERKGIKIATMIHDQCLAYATHSEAEEKLKLLEKCLTSLPPWAAGFPVAVDGKITPYYQK